MFCVHVKWVINMRADSNTWREYRLEMKLVYRYVCMKCDTVKQAFAKDLIVGFVMQEVHTLLDIPSLV